MRPRDGDRVQAIPFNDDGRYADYEDIFPPDYPEGPIEGLLRQRIVDTAFGPRLESIVFTDDGRMRTVESDRIVLLQRNTSSQERLAQIRESLGKKPK